MKTYHPRKHDKSKRINKSEWPSFLLRGPIQERPVVQRAIKGMIVYPA